jgi:hypothetical protein
MNGDYFDRLELELASLTRAGTHVGAVAQGDRRHTGAIIRRGAIILLMALVLAGSLASEFPGSASGHATVARIAIGRGL